MRSKKKGIVIGAGTAGLASAIRLQNAGYEMEIFEKESGPGGKMTQIKKDGFTFDLGPTIVMMPEEYLDIFKSCGRNPKDYIEMVKLDPMYNVFFGENLERKYEVSNDIVKLTSMLENISTDDTEGFFRFLSDIYTRFRIAEKHFIRKSFRKPSDFFNPKTLVQGLKLKTFDSASNMLSKYVKNKDIQSMFSFQTLYIGVSPKKGPSLYNIIPMIELLYGIWFIKGGMYSMAKAMEKLFLELGGKIHYGEEAEEILFEGESCRGIALKDRDISSDFVLCNDDFPYAVKNLIKDPERKGKYQDEKIDAMDYSCSCLIFYFGLQGEVSELEVHNFIISRDIDKNLDQIFEGEKLEDPSFYLFFPSKIDPSLAPKGHTGMYALVPVSDLGSAKYEYSAKTIEEYRSAIINRTKKIPGLDNVEERIVSETVIQPQDFKEKFHSYNGTCFGLQPTLTQSNYFRPQPKWKEAEGLYFCGSSTHPGAGVPIVLESGRLASEEVIKDYGYE